VVGSNRVLQGSFVVNPIGDTNLSLEKENSMRRMYIERALEILQTDVEKPTVFQLIHKYG
jgi:hypothetical protein